MIIPVRLGENGYDILIERGAISRANEFFKINGKALIVTDSGVPEEYAECVKNQFNRAYKVTVPMGEESKSIETMQALFKTMLDNGFTRSDAVIAVGGGVVGDLAGFVSSCYMRGIDFYNIPTTLLSQLDSSVGGKTAVNFGKIKNCIGAFHQPKGVIIDPNVLSTLDERQFFSGFAEAVKMAATSDRVLFERIEAMSKSEYIEEIDSIIPDALKIKADVVTKDEKESGLRKILNFGHTVGHAIESKSEMRLTHGECVGIGMLTMASGEAKSRIKSILEKAGLPTECEFKAQELIEIMSHDKKKSGEKIDLVYVDEIGSGKIIREDFADFERKLKENFQ